MVIDFCPECEGEGVNKRGYICKTCRGLGAIRLEEKEDEGRSGPV